MSWLYTLLVYPLELLFEVVFTISNRIVGNPGWAIIVLSLAVNFLVLPLYNRADEVQKQERDLEASLEFGIARIKNAFKGDERMMMLQAYYRENDYSPLYVLKGSVSLLLQIPFFMAAYNFLSHLALLKGCPFGFIGDLGSPDRMWMIGSLPINVLPIVMTLINIISGYIYTKGMPLKSKIQLYGMALLFLILLYNSPAGLAFYWTLNNVFSLVKNLFYKLKKPGFIFSVFCAVTGLLLAVYANTFYHTPYLSRRIWFTLIGICLIIPTCLFFFNSRKTSDSKSLFCLSSYSKADRNIAVLSSLFLAILTGLLIPSSVIKTSPNEFMDLMNLKNPIIYVIHAFLISCGYFVVWGGIFFGLAGVKARVIISRVILTVCPASLISYLFFGTAFGDISVNFVYYMPFAFTSFEEFINLLLIMVAGIVVILLGRFVPKVCEGMVMTLAIVALIMSIANMIPINRAYKNSLSKVQNDFPRFTLTTGGRNVMVIMLDRAPGYLVPIVFDERPELYEQFDGFTYYPNTLSFGNRTKFGSPALFGGYDYTPEATNSNDKTIRQAQNEALSVMPILFRDEGFEVTLLDPPYANCDIPGDLSIFSGPEFEGIEAYHAKGIVRDEYYLFEKYQEQVWYRNLFCYSIFKISPVVVQPILYNWGQYNEPEVPRDYEVGFDIPQAGFSSSSSGGVDADFMDAYEALIKLDEITVIEESAGNTFMYMDSDVTHDAMLLQAPDYIPYQYVDNVQYDIDHQDRFEDPINGYYLDMSSYTNMRHYTSNAAAYIQLGLYFDYLREQGVWDNTRIIIVADHGISYWDARMFGTQLLAGPQMCIDSFNPVLMVKDFGSTGFTTDDSFMTNADVPYLATCGIINNPVNPFTGNPITIDGVHDMPMYVLDSNDWERASGDSLRFAPDDWYSFNGTQIIDMDSWEFDGTR